MQEKMEELGLSQKQLHRLRENNKVKSYCYRGKRNYLYGPENFTGVLPVN